MAHEDDTADMWKRIQLTKPGQRRRVQAQTAALQMLSDLLKHTDMRLGQVIHALAFVDGTKCEFCHASDEDMALQLTRLRVALLGEVKDDSSDRNND